MLDPHLSDLRAIKRLRSGGMSWAKIAPRFGVTGPTAAKMWREAIDLQKRGKLFEDVNAAEYEDKLERQAI